MKKLLSILLTLVMAICLVNLNNSHTKAEDNDDIPNRIGPHRLSYLMDGGESFPMDNVKKISFSVIEPVGMNLVDKLTNRGEVMGNDVKFYTNNQATEVVFYCKDGFVFNEKEDPSSDYDGYFYGLGSLEEVDFGTNFKLDSNCKKLNELFGECVSLKTIKNLDQLDTRNIEDFSGMFKKCLELTTIDVSNFNTSKATNMSGMFNACIALETLDVSKFNTKNVTDISAMFAGCMKLETLDVSHFNTSKITDMNSMFYGCNKLKSLNLLNFDTRNVTNMAEMFKDCFELESINLGNFDTNNTSIMQEMFAMSDTNKLQTILVGNKWNTEKVLDTGPANPGDAGVNMFEGCNNLVGENGTTLQSVLDDGETETNAKSALYARIDTKDSNAKGYFGKYVPPIPTPDPGKKDESCEKVIGPTWHWNNTKGICEEYSTVGTYTR